MNPDPPPRKVHRRPPGPPPPPLPRDPIPAAHKLTADHFLAWCAGFSCGILWMVVGGAVIDRVLS